jgi:hypothetical protein
MAKSVEVFLPVSSFMSRPLLQCELKGCDVLILL